VPYTEGFKARTIERIGGPERITAYALSKEVGVSQPTLSRWVRERSLGGMTNKGPKKRRTWTATEKFRVIQEASQLSNDELGAFLRREGLHQAQLDEWAQVVKAAALASLAPAKRGKASRSPEERKIRALEKELDRKDKALAEVTAILVLKKKLEALMGDGDDDTDTRSGT
jgi:transposase